MSDYGYPPLPYDWRDIAAALLREYQRERARAALLAQLASGPRYRVRALTLEELSR